MPNLHELDTNTTWVIFNFFTHKEKARIAQVSRVQYKNSANLHFWKINTIIFNDGILQTKSAIAAFYELSKLRNFYSIGPWGTTDTIRFPLLIPMTNGRYRFLTWEDGYDDYIWAQGDNSGLIKKIHGKPMLAFHIMHNPPFKTLFTEQYPLESSTTQKTKHRRFENNLSIKIIAAALSGCASLAASLIVSILFIPIWVLSIASAILTFGLTQCFPFPYRVNLITPFVILPYAVVHSFLHGAALGFEWGFSIFDIAISHSFQSIFNTLFLGENDFDSISYRSFGAPYNITSSINFFGKKTVADLAIEVENNPFNFTHPRITASFNK
jgi:hypothetical protein